MTGKSRKRKDWNKLFTLMLGLVILLAAPAVFAEPAKQTIVVVRHGEKPPEGLGQLTCQGLQRSLRLREAEDDLRGQAECRLELGRLLAATGETEAARSQLGQAARLFVKLDDRERAAETTRTLAGLPGPGGGVQILKQ